MPYGLSTALFVENGPAVQAAQVIETRSTARTWRGLTADCRLALVEHALKPANDVIDAYPLAL
jgi:hypothetical protein